jgi:hypothetical protein
MLELLHAPVTGDSPSLRDYQFKGCAFGVAEVFTVKRVADSGALA